MGPLYILGFDLCTSIQAFSEGLQGYIPSHPQSTQHSYFIKWYHLVIALREGVTACLLGGCVGSY